MTKQNELLELVKAEREVAESDLRDQLEIEFSEQMAQTAQAHADSVAALEKEIKVFHH